MNLRNNLPRVGGGATEVPLKSLRLNIRNFRVSNNPVRRAPASPPVIATGYQPPYMARRSHPASLSAIINFGKNSPAAKASIEAAIRCAAKKPTGELTKEDLEKVRRLVFCHSDITDVTFVACLKQLKFLYLGCNHITDITPLAGPTQLTYLNLNNNHITDFTPLAGLTQLTYLHLANTHLTDVSALSGLRHLKVLRLGRNNLNDVSALAGLTQLKFLDLDSNKITDVSAFGGLSKLDQLYLGSNKLTDVSALTGLKQLTFLSLHMNPKLAKSEIEKLMKALPKCRFHHMTRK